MLSQLKKIRNRISKVVNAAIIALFSLLIMSCAVQVFSRYVLNDSYRWTEELARYSFIWVHFLGTSLCLRTKNHATITFIIDTMPPKIHNVMNLLISLVLFIVSLVLIYGGIKMAELTANQMSVGIRALPMSWVYVSAAFGGAISLVEVIILMAEDINRLIVKKGDAVI
jgi:TRAP-type C4-dicarboxylate transport system permease small subunit